MSAQRLIASTTLAFGLLLGWVDTARAEHVWWDGGGGNSSWHTALNWSGDVLPGEDDDVEIDLAGASVTYSTGTTTINSLTCTKTLTVSGGTLIIEADSSIDGTLTLSGTSTVLTRNGNLTVNGPAGSMVWMRGSLSGTGTLTIADEATLSIVNTFSRTLSGTIANYGTTDWTAGTVNFLPATFDNHAGALFNATATGNVTMGGATSAGSTFNNAGTLIRNAATGTTSFSTGVVFHNADTGLITVQAGTLSIQGTGTNDGTITATGGLNFANTFTHGDESSFAGAGPVELNGGSHNFPAGTFGFTGNLSVNIAAEALTINDAGTMGTVHVFSGNVHVNADHTWTSLTLAGTLAGTGTVTVNGTTTWQSGAMSGSGTTVIPLGGMLNVGANNPLSIARTIDNLGTFTWSVGTLQFNGGTLNNHGTFNASAAASAQGVSGTNQFNNFGVFNRSGNAFTTTFSGATADLPFNNSGALNVSAGTLTFINSIAFTQTGGSTTLNGGALTKSGSAIALQAGNLGGIGTLTGDVDQTGGTLSPGNGVGALTISGMLTQSAEATLAVEIGGLTAGEFDRLTVGTANLGGTLQVSFINGFTPALDNTFELLGAGSVGGAFGAIDSGELADCLQAQYTPTAVTLAVVACGQVDECALGSDNCDANATCTDTPESFTCTCNVGYSGDGVTCTDVNPTVAVNQASGQDDPTSSSPILFQVVFSEPVTDFDSSDVSFDGSTVGGTLVALVAGTDTHYAISVSGMSGSGTVQVSIGAGAAQDVNGLASLASTSTDNEVTFVDPPPTVTIEQASGQADPTSASPIVFSVEFSESVGVLTAADVDLTGSTLGNLVASVEGSGASYTVSVTGMAGSGMVVAAIPANATTDVAGNGNEASTSTDNEVTFVDPPPTVTIEQASGQEDPTAAGLILFEVVFSEPVAGFDGSDVSFEGSTTGGTLVAEVTGADAEYTVWVTGMLGGGVVRAGVAEHAAVSVASGLSSRASTSTDNEVTYSPPLTVTVDHFGQEDPTATLPIYFNVTFSEPVVGFGGHEVLVFGTSGSVSWTMQGSGAFYTLEITNVSESMTINVDVPAGVAQTADGRLNEASAGGDPDVTYVDPRPTVTIDQAPGREDPTSLPQILFLVLFSEPVTGFDASDVTFQGSTTGGTLVAEVAGADALYAVEVSGMVGAGVVRASVAEHAAVSVASGLSSRASTSTDNEVTYIPPPLTVTVDQGPGQEDPTEALPILFTVTFSEPVIDFVIGDFIVGAPGPQVTYRMAGSGANYTVEITHMTDSGTVFVEVPAGVAQTADGRLNQAAEGGDNEVTYDPRPTVTVEQAPGQSHETSEQPIIFFVEFSQSVTGFEDEDVSFAGSTVVGFPEATVLGTGATYFVWVVGTFGSGTLRVSVPAGVAQNADGHPNLASTSFDNEVSYIAPPLSVTVNPASGQEDPTPESPIVFTVTFSEPVRDLDAEDVDLSASTAGGPLEAQVVGVLDEYTVTITGMSESGMVHLSIPAGVAKTFDGRTNQASTSGNATVNFIANTPPVGAADSYAAAGRFDAVSRVLRVNAAEGLLANDQDADADALTADLVAQPDHGFVSLSSNGSFSYRPDIGFFGTDTFTYRADDGTHLSDPQTVTIHVVEPLLIGGMAGSAADDFDSLGQSGVANTPLSRGWAARANGTWTTHTTAAFPPASVAGATYNAGALGDRTLANGNTDRADPNELLLFLEVAGSAAETIRVVAAIEAWAAGAAAPTPGRAIYDVRLGVDDGSGFDRPIELGHADTGLFLVGPPGGGLVDGNSPPYRALFDSGVVGIDAPVGALLLLRFNAQNQGATDHWLFGLDDVAVTTPTANQAPVAEADAFGVDQGGTVSGNVLANDHDPEGDDLTAILIEGPRRAADFDLAADGTFVYTNACTTGGDAFLYVASDGELDSQPATVTLAIVSVAAHLEALERDTRVTPMPLLLKLQLVAEARAASLAWRLERPALAVRALQRYLARLELARRSLAPAHYERLRDQATSALDLVASCTGR